MERVTVADFFDHVALGAGEHEALVFPEQHVRLGYRAAHTRVSQVAKGLMGLGVDRSDHVAIFAPNRVEWILLQLAILKIGAVLVPIDPTAAAAELAHVLQDADVSTLFVLEEADGVSFLDVLLECCPELRSARPGRLASRRFPLLKRVALIGGSANDAITGVSPWTDVLTSGAGITDHLLRRRQEGVEPTDLASLHYTAGTTGAPKGVELTHVNLVSNAIAAGDCMRLGRRDRLCVPVSLSSPFGSVVGTLTALGRGATIVVPATSFDAGATLTVAADERCTALHAEPRMLVSMLRHPQAIRVDLAALRTGIVMGAPWAPDLLPAVAERLHLRELTVAYGLTEATAVITQSRTEDALDLKITTVGRALPAVEVIIVDPKTGNELPTGAEGELCCRGSLVMRGYYKQPEATALTVGRNGWLRTGDLAVMDQYGNCTITGRVPRPVAAPR